MKCPKTWLWRFALIGDDADVGETMIRDRRPPFCDRLESNGLGGSVPDVWDAYCWNSVEQLLSCIMMRI